MEKIKLQLNLLIQKIQSIIKKDKESHFVIVIDGDAGSGKSTLSKQLAEILKAPIVHMDDFYLPFDKREDCATCHMDFERVLKTVLIPFQAQKPLSYDIYNAHEDKILDTIHLNPNKLLILEGSYSFHPSLRPYINISIALTIDAKTQRERIIKRSSPERYEFFENIWIQKEKTYQKESDLIHQCDFHIQNEQR